jgi:hypothetical protein
MFPVKILLMRQLKKQIMKKNKKTFEKGSMLFAFLLISLASFTQQKREGAPGDPYSNMPLIAPIGERIEKYIPVNEASKGPSIDPNKGYRLQELGKGLYMVTDNAYQSMFMVYETGVVVVDAPPPFAQHILKAISEVTEKRITHLIYSHAHIDHIGGTKSLNLDNRAIIIAHEETKRLLVRAKDPNRPIPTMTFKDKYTLNVGSQTLELSYHGVAHEPGNIFI